MAAKDKYHSHIIEALKKDDWIITHDPYIIETQGVNYQVDLGAEKVIAAEKSGVKIAIEVKSFLKESTVSEFDISTKTILEWKE
ncbi:MAG: element excision factor XisH family protein [Bacteroidota bacterium]